MAFTLVGHAVKQAVLSTDDATTAGFDTQTGGTDLIIIAVAYYQGGGGSPTISSSPANTFTARTLYQSTNRVVRLFYKYSPAVSTTQTFTAAVSGNATYVTIMVIAVSGALTSSDPYFAENGDNSASATTRATGDVVPSATDLFITAGAFGNASGTPSVSSFTISDTAVYIGGGVSAGMAYKLNSSGTENETWTQAVASDIAVTLACFKAAAGAGVTVAQEIPAFVQEAGGAMVGSIWMQQSRGRAYGGVAQR